MKIIIACMFILWILLLFIIAVNYFFIPQYYFKKPFFQGRFKVLIEEEGLSVKQFLDSDLEKIYSDNFYKWNLFTKKAENSEGIFLFEGIKKVWIFPKSAFSTKAELEEFRNFLEKSIPAKTFLGEKLWGETK